jgi:energy-coupling factor transport system ATP-binding protein
MFIRTEKLTHTYMPGTPFAAQAIHDVTINIEKGRVALLIGPSGSGKSTLIQHLNGLLKPTAGQVFFEERSIAGFTKADLLALRRRVGLVFQMPEEQFFSETVFDEIAFAPRNLGVAESDLPDRVKEALSRVGLETNTFSSRHPFHLSSGQKRLVAIAAVLSLRPEVLVLDEPTAGLDPSGRRNLFDLLTCLNHNDNLTILICTHHFDEAAALADQVVVLSRGSVAMDGSRDEVFSRREELEALGLSLPSVTAIMHDLAAAGKSVRTDIFTLDDALRELKSLKEKG